MNDNEIIENDVDFCIDLFQKIDDILKKQNISSGDLGQIHSLVKQGLKLKKDSDLNEYKFY